MFTLINNKRYQLKILKSPHEMEMVEDLQRIIWPGNEVDIVPMHILLTFAHNGGIVIGAFEAGFSPVNPESDGAVVGLSQQQGESSQEMVGFVFGFPGLYDSETGIKIKHCSHQLGVIPRERDQGIGFFLKRAQWQMVRQQGVDLITWTYDPLQSRNANLNVARLGVICNTYICDAYGVMKDDLNAGLASDRFQVEWWINSNRVNRRLSKRVRQKLDLAHYLSAGVEIINPTVITKWGLPVPPEVGSLPRYILDESNTRKPQLILLEIPPDINKMKRLDMDLAKVWRQHSREYLMALFESGYLVSDFVYLPGAAPRSFYILVHGESTL